MRVSQTTGSSSRQRIVLGVGGTLGDRAMMLDDSTAELAALAGSTRTIARRLPAGPACAALMAAEALDSALLRLEALTGQGDDPQQDPLVLRVQTGVPADR